MTHEEWSGPVQPPVVAGRRLIAETASVSKSAKVLNEARVYDHAQVRQNARIIDAARVYGHAAVFGSAEVGGNARIYGEAAICGYAEISGNARVFGEVEIYGHARVRGNAIIETQEDVAWVDRVGTGEGLGLTLHRVSEGWRLDAGCRVFEAATVDEVCAEVRANMHRPDEEWAHLENDVVARYVRQVNTALDFLSAMVVDD